MAINSIGNVSSPAVTGNSYVEQPAKQPAVFSDEPIKVKDGVEEETDVQHERQQASNKTVEDAVKRANNKMNKTRCEFSYNNEVNRVSITVYDDETGEVIREIPPEESLKMLEKLWELTGLMVDEKR